MRSAHPGTVSAPAGQQLLIVAGYPGAPCRRRMGWLERWRGRSPRALPAAEEFPTLPEIAARWRDVEHGVRGYLSDLKEDALARPFSYANLRDEMWTYPLWRTLLHLVNHQTYHRFLLSP